ncbi:MAG: PQ-loop repeat-containing protein [Gammaproteobacteria bacterium]|nr:PQ-loop repeat-containing protein [Gammaproteobacteria bacterium]
MTAHTLGEITLSISSVVYFIWFLPQLWLNFKRKNTDGLSLWMHGLLLLGYSADLVYGFGRHMQWQYRMVTIVGLISLFAQHVQFFRYGLHSRAIKNNFTLLTVLASIAFFYAVFNCTFGLHSKKYDDVAGFVSDLCWMFYLLPQIIKNYIAKSTVGLSPWFIILAIFLSLLDMTSTFALGWDWPSILGAGISLAGKAVLIFQILLYQAVRKRRRKPAYNARI